MSSKILQVLIDISFSALIALAFASMISIFTGLEYNWNIACNSFIAIVIAYTACRLIERSLDGSSGDD